MSEERLFDQEPVPKEVAKATPPTARVRFLAGMLAAWTFGDVKLKATEQDAMTAIAIDAIERATGHRRG